jgi:hypothetical protein
MPTVTKPLTTDSTWSSTNGTFCQTWSQSSKTWVRTPGYKAKQRAGLLPHNPYDIYLNRGTYGARWKRITTRISDGFQTGDAYGDSAATLSSTFYAGIQRCIAKIPTVSTEKNALIINALSRASEMHINLPVAFAEASRTSNMILDRAKRLADSYRAFRRGDLRKVARILNLNPRTAHKNWLEYKYGWMPLLMDVKGGAEAIAQARVRRPQRFRVSSKASRETKDDMVSITSSVGGSQNVHNLTTEFTRQLRCQIDLEVTNPHLASAQQLGLTNPALIAWELVPFSFVADWFISVGDYLKATTALQGLTVRKALFSYREHSTCASRYATSAGADVNFRYSAAFSSWSAQGDVFHRESVTIDILSLYPPRHQDPFKDFWDRVVTGAALLRSATGRR